MDGRQTLFSWHEKGSKFTGWGKTRHPGQKRTAKRRSNHESQPKKQSKSLCKTVNTHARNNTEKASKEGRLEERRRSKKSKKDIRSPTSNTNSTQRIHGVFCGGLPLFAGLKRKKARNTTVLGTGGRPKKDTPIISQVVFVVVSRNRKPGAGGCFVPGSRT